MEQKTEKANSKPEPCQNKQDTCHQKATSTSVDKDTRNEKGLESGSESKNKNNEELSKPELPADNCDKVADTDTLLKNEKASLEIDNDNQVHEVDSTVVEPRSPDNIAVEPLDINVVAVNSNEEGTDKIADNSPESVTQQSPILGKRASMDSNVVAQAKRSRSRSGSTTDVKEVDITDDISDIVATKSVDPSKEDKLLEESEADGSKKKQKSEGALKPKKERTNRVQRNRSVIKQITVESVVSKAHSKKEKSSKKQSKEQKETSEESDLNETVKSATDQGTKKTARGIKKPKGIKVKKNVKQGIKDYQRGDRVFAKVRGYSPWPAVITAPAGTKPPYVKYHVSFYGTLQTGVCKVSDIFPYELYKNVYGIPKNKSQAFQRALSDIKKASG